MRSKLGYAARDFLYYKKRCGRDVARLEVIDFDQQTEAMVANGKGERKARLVLTKKQPKEMQVSISPMKHMREKPISDEEEIHDTLDEYKIWLRDLKKEYPETDLKDDFGDHTIETYKEWLNAQGLMEHIVSASEENNNDVDERSTSPKERPSHARRATCTRKDCRQPNKRTSRGTLKGFAAAMKRIRSPVGKNHRSFINEVSVFTRQKDPLIGVRTWSDIDEDVQGSIAADILSRWELKDTMDAKEKILSIANQQYRGWRGTLSATSKAYGRYSEAMKNKPKDVDLVEWHYLYMYFNIPDFKQLSCGKSKCLSNKKSTHLGGSKPFSQNSYEQRDPRTGEEPSDLTLWMSTHMKNGRWSDEISKAVYSSYNDTTGCKSSRLHGRGYPAKRQTLTERMRVEMDEHA
ncbi:hypothetical protein BS78_K006800 [Paspalum vaginatum]|uniref:Uncharacterized protein n=1 Tax=Paspalum vaginatum TaxID=158149 RepID=A0A9W7XCF0_9POAL|nr:hypothetical protein BS78_K006800 [Paspalum vaginatum]